MCRYARIAHKRTCPPCPNSVSSEQYSSSSEHFLGLQRDCALLKKRGKDLAFTIAYK